jgi:dihydropyrimidinase
MVIRNGTIVTPDIQSKGDVLILDGKIAGVRYHSGSDLFENDAYDKGFQDFLKMHGLEDLTFEQHKQQVINASGCFVFAGGIDPHVHMHLPTSSGYSSDDFSTGSCAALIGGTTTMIDFVTPAKGQNLMDALDQRKTEADACCIDHSFHVSPVEWHDGIADEIHDCVASGITSFKVYMAYKGSIGIDDAVIESVMHIVGRAGGLLLVHAELGDDIDRMRDKLFFEGKTGPSAHPLSRPELTEGLAVKKIIEMAERAICPVYIVHVSTKIALDHIRKAQQQGQKVYAEVCPHHLLFDDSKYAGDFFSAAPYVMSPPLRKQHDQEALWNALADGTIQTVGTDHCPFMMEQKMQGRDDFRKIANGVGGVEHRLELLYTYGVLNNRISMMRFVDLVSAQPAKIFGLYKHKGNMEPGADADLVVWNPDPEKVISSANHYQNCDHNIYEGFSVKGRAEYVMVRGKVVVVNGKLIGKPKGRHLGVM